MPILTRCCCFDLRTGSMIISVVVIAVAFITFITNFLGAIRVRTIVIEPLPPVLGIIIISLNFALVIVSCVLLLIGAIYRKPWLLLPFLVIHMIMTIGALISTIFTSINLLLDRGPLLGVLSLILGLTIVGLYFFFWLVVLSYYQFLRMQEFERTSSSEY